jgi:toxin-antitoxin system PIN domain toxin
VLIADVNVLVYAFRPSSERHAEYKDWLESALTGTEPFGVSELVLSGFVRIVTNHRIYQNPDSTEPALEFCTQVLDAPAAVPARPSPRHWSIFVELCRATSGRGNAVPDAYHAALAVDHGATWVTTDRGVARFPDLRWIHPLDG